MENFIDNLWRAIIIHNFIVFKFIFEVASELGVPLSDGYNGNLTSKQNGSVGGYMVKKMIEAQERKMAGK